MRIAFVGGKLMTTIETVTISTKYQIVIPKKARESMGLKSGERLKLITYDGRIELIPVKPMKFYRGIAAGMDTRFDRDEDRHE
jgi:AbrB family looped-hinge helix DNA binding protein